MANGHAGVPRVVALSSPLPTNYFASGNIPDLSAMFPPVAHRPEPEAVKAAKRFAWAPGQQFAWSWPWNFWRDLYGR